MQKKILPEKLVGENPDALLRFFLADQAVRGVVVRGTRLVNEMRLNHGLGILETLVLGHAYLGAALLSTTLKSKKERLRLQVECSGPIKGLLVEVNGAGEVRGYLQAVPIPVESEPTSFDLAPFFGAGFLSVSRYLEDARRPFTGKIMLEYGNLAQDLSNYYLTSEQIPTATALSIQFNQAGEVAGAGGLFLQAMPNAEPALMKGLTARLKDFPSLGRYLAQGGELGGVLGERFADFRPEVLARGEVSFHCPCNGEAISALLLTLPPADLAELLSKGPFPLEVSCHYCNTSYFFTRPDLERLRLEQADGKRQ
ncbi:Hsp33 family molecular chaperone HslO [Thiovibrio sp. JS02]